MVIYGYSMCNAGYSHNYDVLLWLYMVIWLVAWNMFYIYPYIGNNKPNWLSYFSEGLKPRTSCSICKAGYSHNYNHNLGSWNFYTLQE